MSPLEYIESLLNCLFLILFVYESLIRHTQTPSVIRERGQISPRVSICSLPDNVLLDIFEFYQAEFVGRAMVWSRLVHVCQRWRYIVFASPLRLDLRILCTEWTPVEMMDVWPPLPIDIRTPFVGDNTIAAFEHRNRVRSISLSGKTIPLERLVAVMQEPFPAMDALTLQVEGSGGTVPALPKTFLSGSAPHLRSLTLDGIAFPALPRLLLSSNDLVDLTLQQIPHSGYISPEAMARCIYALTKLTELSIGFKSPASRPDPITRHPPPLTRAVLPALTNLDFHGVSEYLEDLMARINAPLLRAVAITFLNQLVFDVQQLSRITGYAPVLMSCNTANMFFSDSHVNIHFSTRPFSTTGSLRFKISCGGVDWQVSSMAQIFNQLSFLLSGIDQLDIYSVVASTWKVDMDDTQWLELFRPFTALQTLRMSGPLQSLVMSALQGPGGEWAMEVLPTLDNLHLARYQASGSMLRDTEKSVIARQHPAHAVTVHHGDWRALHVRVMSWVYEALIEDAKLESFFASIPEGDKARKSCEILVLGWPRGNITRVNTVY
ncbi:hypothetical protein BGW80DRAFT_1446400 [Lactifluus volemus]|nr:hypothetical protein BGW80DRAFT_1446400 [Lactifluus volemus]